MARLFFSLCIAAFVSLLAAPAGAQELSGPCPVGKMVEDRQGNKGVVIDTDPVGCHVRQPDGSGKYYLSWMLHLTGNPIHTKAEMAAIPPGKYSCYGSGHYLFMDINIRSAGSYTDVDGKPGAYSYDPKTQMIVFKSGTFSGDYSKYLGKDGIGLASKPTDFWATTCTR